MNSNVGTPFYFIQKPKAYKTDLIKDHKEKI